MRSNWRLDRALLSAPAKFIVGIPQDEIDQQRFDYIESFTTRIAKNAAYALMSRSSLHVFFPEYDDDPREIYQIPEVRAWFQASIHKGIPWFYFLETESPHSSLGLLAFCSCEVETVKVTTAGHFLRFQQKSFEDFIAANFENLNRFTESIGLSREVNREISDKVTKFYLETAPRERL